MPVSRILGLLLSLSVTALAAAVFWFGFLQIGAPATQNLKNAAPEKKAGANSAQETAPEKIIELEPPASAAAPVILTPVKKIVSAPAVKLPELTQSQVVGNGALTRAGVIDATNRQRQIYLGAGYGLKENAMLDIAAASKIEDMFGGQYFEHISPLGRDAMYFAGLSGYEYIAIGENLAKGNYAGDDDLVQAWMDSSGHRENILKSGYKEIGAAVAYGLFEGKNTWLAVQIFAVPESACPRVDADLSLQISAGQKNLDRFSQEQNNLLARINGEKSRALVLEKELNNLISSGAADATIKAKQSALNIAITAANRDVASYNNNIKEMKTAYDDYKTKIDKYNSQVAAFNACASAIK